MLRTLVMCLCLCLCAVSCDHTMWSSPSPRLVSAAIRIEAGSDIQAVVDSQPPGTAYILQAGIHRLQSIVPQDHDLFIGEPGAVLNGARLITEFEQSGEVWAAAGQTDEPWNAGYCAEGVAGCSQAHDLYFDDTPLRRVTTPDEVVPGSWFFDYAADTIYVGSDPAHYTVELSSAFYAFSGEATGVTIRNLTIEKYAGPGQIPAVRATEGRNWRIENNLIWLNSGGGVGFGEQTQVIDNRILSNGQIGLSGIGSDVLVEGNEIAYNNYAGYSQGWEAGGTKFVGTQRLIVRANYVHHNDGPGLWTDIDNIDTVYEDNIVIGNSGIGIFHEISYDAVIRRNTVKFNHPTPADWLYGGQIVLSASGNVEVYENEVVVSASGGNAITILQQDRGEGVHGEYLAVNNTVRHNTIIHLGSEGQTAVAGLEDSRQERSNTIDHNRYLVADLSGYYWGFGEQRRNWEAVQASGYFEPHGSVSDQIPLSAFDAPPEYILLR